MGYDYYFIGYENGYNAGIKQGLKVAMQMINMKPNEKLSIEFESPEEAKQFFKTFINMVK